MEIRPAVSVGVPAASRSASRASARNARGAGPTPSAASVLKVAGRCGANPASAWNARIAGNARHAVICRVAPLTPAFCAFVHLAANAKANPPAVFARSAASRNACANAAFARSANKRRLAALVGAAPSRRANASARNAPPALPSPRTMFAREVAGNECALAPVRCVPPAGSIPRTLPAANAGSAPANAIAVTAPDAETGLNTVFAALAETARARAPVNAPDAAKSPFIRFARVAPSERATLANARNALLATPSPPAANAANAGRHYARALANPIAATWTASHALSARHARRRVIIRRLRVSTSTASATRWITTRPIAPCPTTAIA